MLFNATVFECFCNSTAGPKIPRIYTKTGDKGWLSFNFVIFIDDINRMQNTCFHTNLDFNEARDDRVAVASAGPYANHLHLTSDR